MKPEDLQAKLDQMNARQKRADVHPYTCGNNSRHQPLVATPGGWACPDCSYRQPYRGELGLRGCVCGGISATDVTGTAYCVICGGQADWRRQCEISEAKVSA